jgi:hydrogenase-4 component F
MTALYLTLLLPVIGALVMFVIGNRRISAYCNIIISTASFVSALFVVWRFLQHGAFMAAGNQFYIDSFNSILIILTAFVMMTTAFFSNTFMWRAKPINHMRLYNVLYQLFAFTLFLGLSTNNIGILWVAVEGAALSTVLLVDLLHTKESVEAAWKYFILGIVGVGLALFGTILVYSSDTHHNSGMLWTTLVDHAAYFDPVVMKIAFVFLLVGYGTKIGFVPLHNWLPDAYSQSLAPVAILSGLLLNVSLYALVKFKILTNLVLNNRLADNLMITFGLLSFIVAAVLLQRQNNIKRLFSYSSIEHMGLITFAFGLGTKDAVFVGLLYLIVNSLTKAAIFSVLDNVLDHSRGLIKSHPKLGWSVLIATLVISGAPPFGIFTSESMLFINCVKCSPLFAVLLVIGLVMALSGLLRNIQPVVYGDSTSVVVQEICLWPVILHLSLVLILGVYIPPVLQQLLHGAAKLITG